MEKFLIIDGNSLINRAFYGVRGLSRSDGMPTNALFGFVNYIKRYLDILHPDYFVCAFDMHHPTFRHEKYDKYKSNRHGMPDELASQMPYAHRLAEALGASVLEAPGYEADDIIGTAAGYADRHGGIETYILTGDRDSLQLISDHTTVILMRNREDEHFNREHFNEVYGITPEQFVDVKALMGDSSDCIPGIAGIGEKTALKLISASGSLDALYASADSGYFGATKSVAGKLDAGRESAYMSQELARICTEAPLGRDTESYRLRATDRTELYRLFRELEFGNFIRKFGLEGIPDGQMIVNSDSVVGEEEIKITDVGRDEFIKLLPDGVVTVNYDCGEISVLTENGVLVCRNADAAALAAVFNRSVVCHDLKNLTKALSPFGITPDCTFDTMLADYLLRPGRSSYTLEATSDGCGIRYSPEKHAAPYMINACREYLAAALEREGMTSLLQEIEIPLATVLADIENVGFKIDVSGIRRYAAELLSAENSLADSVYSLAGHDFNINSPKQLGNILFEELGLPAGKKTKTGYSTNAETLERLRYIHPIVSEILAYRQVAKLRGTYGDALADMADENGRIHTTLNQCGTATGRLSSNDPNLQNIPVRGELGRELRKYFTADDSEHVLIDADYSQIELRLLAHLSGDEAMIAAFNSDTDIHTMTAASVFGISPEKVTPDLRRRAKAVNFGIVYGIGAYSLSQDIGSTRRQAEEYIEGYFRTYPGVERYLKETVDHAIESGSTVTMFGRKRWIPELSSKNHNISAFGRRVAMNSPIQGSAADIIKVAMINVSRALRESGIDARLIMQVHDELIVESSRDCAEMARDILVREMEGAAKLRVPLSAEAGIGDNWFDAK